MNIIIQRGKVVKLKDLPEYAIAIDGFVQGPEIDTENHRYSFDHHSNCLRFCTSASCVQAWTAILGGLDSSKYTVYCNDVDVDVCMSIWCLKNADRCTEPLVKKLVDAVGILDMHAGAIPVNGMTKVVEWVSAPQTDSLRNGDYSKLSDDGLMTILESMLHRITQYVNGDASADIADRDVQSNFDIKKNENGWVLVESPDPHVYTSLYRSGFDRIVLIRPQDDNSNAISIAKRTDFIDNFPLDLFYKELNKIEPGWGGGSTIGGAPRNDDGSRSKLSIETIVDVINNVIDGKPIVVTKKKVTKKTIKARSKKSISK